MKIYSFTQDGAQMIPVEVELNLIPGLPQVQFTGLPDTAIKESVMRIKSAIRSQGFEWPKTRQLIINLRPSYLKKHSHGLDLAIACALLWKTKQLKPPVEYVESNSIFIYGELSLEGEVFAPKSLENISPQKKEILTGKIEGENYLCPLLQVESLKDLEEPIRIPVQSLSDLIKKPALPNIYFSKLASRLLQVCAAGEHSVLLAGEAGSGKSTLLEHLPVLLQAPSLKDFSVSRRLWASAGEELSWRPFVNPHHSTTTLSMIGGGYPLFFGEISKAHGGVLFMDEYLEFHPRVQEALREPMEKGEIRIVRKGKSEVFPASFMLVAATNLCPCGDFVPGKPSQCSYSLRRCFSHLDRLNGPMLDRFDVLAFSPQWKGSLTIPLEEIQEAVFKARELRKKRGQETTNGKLTIQELENSLPRFIRDNHLSFCVSSKRRKRSVLRVARTIADLEGMEQITPRHIESAKEFSFMPFVQLKNRCGF